MPGDRCRQRRPGVNSSFLTFMPLDVAKIRADFPILAAELPTGRPLVYLDNAATTQRPRQVIQAIVDVYERTYANVHRGIHWLSERATDDYEIARRKLAGSLTPNAARR